MSRCMYDYAVEMMRSYHEEEPKEFFTNYSRIASQLVIKGKEGRKQVSIGIKKKFYELYRIYVETLLENIKEQSAIFVFQSESYKIRRNNKPRRGVFYYESNLDNVLQSLPELDEGEEYIFPILRIIRNNGVDEPFIFDLKDEK